MTFVDSSLLVHIDDVFVNLVLTFFYDLRRRLYYTMRCGSLVSQ